MKKIGDVVINKLIMNLKRFLGKQSNPFILIIGFVLVLIIGVIDFTTGTEISISVFYLLPIYLVTWFSCRWFGVLIAFASAIVWLIADLLSGHIYSHPLIPYWNMAVRLFFFLTLYLLVRLNKKLHLEEQLSRTDALTQVANRRLFYHLADMEISRARRNASPFTMAYLDLDNFKLMNDRFGHRIGDTLLCLVASTIQKNLRRSDTVARLGGDEFAILLPETGREAADEVLDRLRKLLLDLMSEKGWPVTLSVGAMTFIHPPDSVDEMIRSADDLMYSVKQSSKNMIQYGVFRKS